MSGSGEGSDANLMTSESPPSALGRADRGGKWDLVDAAAVVCFDAGALGLGAWFAGLVGLVGLAGLEGANGGAAGGMASFARIVLVLPAVVLVARRHWDADLPALGVRRPAPGSWLWFLRTCLVLAAVYAALGLGLALAFRGRSGELAVRAGAWVRNAGLAWWCFRAFVAAPVVEELVFRGVLYAALRRRMRARYAVPLSAAVFAAMHPLWAWHPFIPWTQFLGGLIFAWSYEKTRSLLHPVIFHVIGNAGILALNLVLAHRPGWVEGVLG